VDFKTIVSRKPPCFQIHCLNAFSSVLRDGSEWFCWLSSGEPSHNACTAPISILWEAVSAAQYPLSFEQTSTGVQFTASFRIMPQISVPCQVPPENKSKSLEKCWGPGYCGANVNWLPTCSMTYVAFWYLSSQLNKFQPKSSSSWCNSSGCQSR